MSPIRIFAIVLISFAVVSFEKPPEAKAGLIIDPAISGWSDQDHIDFSTSLPFSQFALFAYNPDGSLGAISSSYAIKDGTNIGVKSARHSFFDANGNMFNRFEYRLGSDFNNPDQIFALELEKIHFHDGGRDYAITFPDFGARGNQIRGASLYTGVNAALDESEVVIAGLYGLTGNTTTGFTSLDGKVRAGMKVISSVNSDAEAWAVFTPPQFSRYRAEAILVGPGDSGGAALIYDNSELYSIGLVRGGFGSGIDFQGISVFTLNDYSFDSEILRTYGGASVPEPSSVVLLLLAAVATVLRRRSRIFSVG